MKRKIFKSFSEDGGFYITSIIFLAFAVFAGSYGGFHYALIGVCFWLFALMALIFTRLVSFSHNKGQRAGQAVMSNVTLDFIMHFEMPVVIIGINGDIIWYNKSFSKVVQNTAPLYNFPVQDFLSDNLSLERVKRAAEKIANRDGEEEKPIVVTMRDIRYRLHVNLMQSAGTHYYITVWQDMSQVFELIGELKAKNPLVAYITVDNAAETTGLVRTEYRTIAAKIAILLREWADSLNGVLREVDKEKFLFVFEEGNLEQVVAQKFEILDQVRDISLSAGAAIPITVSLGVAATGDTLIEKERIAAQALDLALQRGGDQAVVKTRTGNEIYGGRSKTVQKKNKVRSRVVAAELKNLVKKSDNVIIMGHKFADYDCIGACIGIARLALQHCSKVNIVVNISDSNLKGVFRKLKGIGIYRDIFIDAATAQDLIGPETLVVAVDVNNPTHFEAPEVYRCAAKTVVIDHHRKTVEYEAQPAITYIEPSASSTCELVCEILEQAMEPGLLLKEEAEILFSGILLDTKQFTRNTGVRTFAAALFLRGEGADPNEAQMMFKIDLAEFTREAMFENNVVVYRNIIAISILKGEAAAPDKIAASKVAERLLTVDGVLASFALCEIDGTVHISARSAGTVNVQLIAEKLGGGGHFDMAGAQLANMPMQQALVQLKKVIDEYLSEE